MPIDTSKMKGGPAFRSTAWTIIRGAQEQDAAVRDDALGRLIGVYWRPVYWTFRLDWNAGPEEAKDLTQEYFAVFLEKDMIRQVAPERGRFRAYVKATIRNFVLSRRRDAKALKRGGGRRIVALDDLAAVEANATAQTESPEQRFDRELMRAITLEAQEELRRRTADRPELFLLFESYYLADTSVHYEELCRQFDINHHDVKNRLAEMRAQFKEIVLDILRDGVTSDDELEDEIREVFGM